MKQANLCPFVVVNDPFTLVNPDVVTAPALAFVYSTTIEHARVGGASVWAPPFVACCWFPFVASGANVPLDFVPAENDVAVNPPVRFWLPLALRSAFAVFART